MMIYRNIHHSSSLLYVGLKNTRVANLLIVCTQSFYRCGFKIVEPNGEGRRRWRWLLSNTFLPKQYPGQNSTVFPFPIRGRAPLPIQQPLAGPCTLRQMFRHLRISVVSQDRSVPQVMYRSRLISLEWDAYLVDTRVPEMREQQALHP